ncbi:MAG: DNA polymerase III subunit delta, partial [Candidatus Aminicenantes bacterium]|nr:DNA polymerase III subunit delta [Candidatus Aminicenantes bacterium]
MRSALLGREIREADLLPAYFFYGEELFQAEQFIRDLQRALVSPEVQGISLERFDLEETGWRDILDVARTIAFFFSPWRLLVVAIEQKSKLDLSATEQQIIKEYFGAPTQKTVLIVLFTGKIRKTSSLYRLFSSLPKTAVRMEELKVLKNESLFTWVNEKLAALGKRASSEAIDRLVEMTGNNLQQLDSELEKLATYVGEKKTIDVADVNQLADWVKNYLEWELTACLERSDLEQALMVLNKRFQEGDRPEHVLYNLVNFCRDLLAAKVWLREKMDRKDIFRELKPQIPERMGRFYWTRHREFFSLVDRLSQKEIVRFVTRLEQLDLKLKTTDTSPQALFESFVFDY